MSGAIYRLDGGPNDWQNAIENKRFVGKPLCNRASLSCCTSIVDARQRRAMRSDWENCRIVVGHLSPEHGKILQTGKDAAHHSLWLRRPALAAIRDLFKVVE